MCILLNPPTYYNFKLEKIYYELLHTYLVLKDIKSIDGEGHILNSIFSILSKLKIEKHKKYKQFLLHFIIFIFHKRQYKNDIKNPHSKDIFYKTIVDLYDYEPDIVLYLIYYEIIPVYGYIKDYFNIWKSVLKKIKNEYNITLIANIKTKHFELVYNKYNSFIIGIISVINHIKKRDLQKVDDFIKKTYNKTQYNNEQFNIDINWFKLGLYALQNIGHISRNNLLGTYFKHNRYSNKLAISKVATYIPKQNKSKDIVWYINYNEFKKNKKTEKHKKYHYKKINVFDYLVLYEKIYNKNINDIQVNNNDRRRYRIDCSILNRVNDIPQIHMCENSLKNIDFKKSSARFIKNNKNLLLMNDVKSQLIINNTDYNLTLYSNDHNRYYDKIIAKRNYLSHIEHLKKNYILISKKLYIKKQLFYCRNIYLLFHFKENELNKYSNIIKLKNNIVFNNNYKPFFFIINDLENFTRAM